MILVSWISAGRGAGVQLVEANMHVGELKF